MIFVVIIFGALLLVMMSFIAYRLMQPQENTELTELLRRLDQDKSDRHREQESLKSELRDVNKSMDFKLSENTKQLNQRLDKTAEFMIGFQREVKNFSEKTGGIEKIGKDLQSLQQVFRGTKTRGSLGEVALKEILTQVLPKEIWEQEYRFANQEKVDFAIKTESGIIPIDSKYPLESFERLVNASNEAEEISAKKEFETAVKKQIQQTAKYIRPSEKTVNFAFLFLPNENMYYEATARNEHLSDIAREHKVLLTSPSTMHYALQIVLQSYQNQKFAEKAQEALSHLHEIHSQGKRLDESLSLVETHVERAQNKIQDTKKENQKLQSKIEQTMSLESSVEDEASSSKPKISPSSQVPETLL